MNTRVYSLTFVSAGLMALLARPDLIIVSPPRCSAKASPHLRNRHARTRFARYTME